MSFRKCSDSVVFITFVCVVYLKAGWTNGQGIIEGQCFTPNGQVGNCLNIKKCSPLLALLMRRPVNPSALQLLRQSKCGFDGLDPKVCCPTSTRSNLEEENDKDSNEVDHSPPNIDSSYDYYREHPPSVERHPNLSLLPSHCGDSEDDRIFGGNTTSLLEFPWMALLKYQRKVGFNFACGGTIINSRYILTAAHCLTNTLIGVRVGEHDLRSELDCERYGGDYTCTVYNDFDIEEILPHPNYKGGKGKDTELQNDIGLIRLAANIEFEKHENTLPICLPTTKELQEFDTKNVDMIVAGWGFVNNSATSPILLKINIPIMDNSPCARIFNGTVRDGVGFRQMCAGGVPGVDACNGDSGGPLKYLQTVNDVPRFVEYGIVSFGTKPCGRDGIPGVFTRVAYYMNWILDNLKP